MTLYLWIKALHVISIISWMAGIFYLPRLYVYHCKVRIGSNSDMMLQTMEHKLLRIIMNPAMILSFVFGIWMLTLEPYLLKQGWMHFKLLLVILMTIMHMYFAKCRKKFQTGENANSERFYRLMNEVPVVFMIGIVILVIVMPF